MKSYNPLVSIIIPIYNSEKFLYDTLKSLYDQSYNNFEVIFVNDGSTDSSVNIINSFLRPDVDMYIYQDNKGVKRLAETLNSGLSFCKGELVTMLPSDDLWPEYRLKNQVPYFLDKDLVMVHGKMLLISENGKSIKLSKIPPSNYFARHNFPFGSILPFLLKENFIAQPTCLIRKEVLVRIGGYLQPNDNFAEDYPTHLELSKYGKIIFIEDNLIYGYYRQHEAQMTKNYFPQMVESDCDLILNFVSSLDIKWKEKFDLDDKFIRKIILHKKSVIPYMEAKRLFSIQDFNSFFPYFIQCLSVSPINLKVRLFIFIFLSWFNLSDYFFKKK
jgi:glycosyltransferase involved in cell wall biosynthesis